MFETLKANQESLARIAAHRARLRFVNGVEWLTRDPSSVVGRTPYDVIHRDNKLEVRRYRPPRGAARRYGTPVLMIPPLMVKPFVFDLHAGRSMVSHFLEAGFSVYLVDFGEPDRADAFVTLDDYVLDWIPQACAVTRKDAGAKQLSLMGYCMGALFALSHTAANLDRTVRNIVAIAAPVDTNKMGLFAWMAKVAGPQVEQMTRRMGNIPGSLSGTAFKLLTPKKNVTRYADLMMNMWDKEYMNGFDAMNQWTSQFIDYPQAAFNQFLRDFLRKNKLYRGKLRFGGKVADLKSIGASLLAIAGKTDQIAPAASVRGAMRAVGAEDKTYLVVPGGHMGVMAGSTAPEHVWTPIAAWLGERSVRARRPRATAKA